MIKSNVSDDSINILNHYKKALEWIKINTLPEQGIVVTSKQRIPYLEVTGYLIPTLIDANELILAKRYAEYLCYMQRPNGAFAGPNGKEYVFDSGQALRGLIRASQQWAEFRPYAVKTADYIVSCIERDGRIPSIYPGNISEHVHIFILPALAEASQMFNNKDYLDKAKLSISYYKESNQIININMLTHFLAYIIDGFIDMGEQNFVNDFVNDIFINQLKNGMLPAYPDKNWTCSTGLAQFSIIAYKLGMNVQAEKAINYLCTIQNDSGGFFGSYGRGSEYFKDEEISWANKFFLDAIHLRMKYLSKRTSIISSPNDTPLDRNEWHNVIIGKQHEEAIINKIQSNLYPIWSKELLKFSSPNDTMLELGSGTGELSAILAIYHRIPLMLDYSEESIKFSKNIFKQLHIDGHFYHHDILNGIPLENDSVDWVWSSGLLEHFTDDQIGKIMNESMRICKKGVMSFVPNANSLLYRTGKYKMEQSGTWLYGKEAPKFSMIKYFESAGLKNLIEFSVAPYHSINFINTPVNDTQAFYDSLSVDELQNLNQGYLLFTYGKKSNRPESND